jgi:hypothetical protein
MTIIYTQKKALQLTKVLAKAGRKEPVELVVRGLPKDRIEHHRVSGKSSKCQ